MVEFLEYSAFIIISIVLAACATYYKSYYPKKEKAPIKEVLEKSKRFFIVCSVCYITFAVLGLVFRESKAVSMVSLVQFVLLWDIFFLISAIDYRLKKIPNQLLLVLLGIRAVGIVTEVIINPENLIATPVGSLIGMLIGGLIILVCMLISRGGVGAGDMKLYALVGFFLYLEGILSVMMCSLFLAAIVSIVMLISKKAKMKSTLAMAPFIFAGLNVYFIFYQ